MKIHQVLVEENGKPLWFAATIKPLMCGSARIKYHLDGLPLWMPIVETLSATELAYRVPSLPPITPITAMFPDDEEIS